MPEMRYDTSTGFIREIRRRPPMLLNMKVVSFSMGVFFVISFILCVVYGQIVPPRLHMMAGFLEAVLPAFKWLTFWGFIIGLIESFLYGVYIGIVFVAIYNFFNTRICAVK